MPQAATYRRTGWAVVSPPLRGGEPEQPDPLPRPAEIAPQDQPLAVERERPELRRQAPVERPGLLRGNLVLNRHVRLEALVVLRREPGAPLARELPSKAIEEGERLAVEGERENQRRGRARHGGTRGGKV